MALDALIALEGVERVVDGVAALRGVSLAVAPGEALAIIGPSGSGKTTLLRLIAGLDQPTAGAVRLRGQVASTPEWAAPPHRRGLGMVFQRPALWPHMTVVENVAFGLAALPPLEAKRRLAEVLGLTHLAGLERRRPHQLSGGEAQRVALARAIAPRPGALLLDEPLSGLDPELHAEMLALFGRVHADLGTALVYVTHDHAEARSIARRVVVLRRGRVEHDGRWEAVRSAEAVPWR